MTYVRVPFDLLLSTKIIRLGELKSFMRNQNGHVLNITSAGGWIG